MPVGNLGRRTYIRVYEKPERLPKFVLVSSRLHARMRYFGITGFIVAHPAVFNTHCGTAFCVPKNPGIHPVMPDPTPTAAILSELVRTHKHEVRIFYKYQAVNCACKKVIIKLILEKYCKSLSSRIIGFAKVTSFQILTHLILHFPNRFLVRPHLQVQNTQ